MMSYGLYIDALCHLNIQSQKTKTPWLFLMVGLEFCNCLLNIERDFVFSSIVKICPMNLLSHIHQKNKKSSLVWILLRNYIFLATNFNSPTYNEQPNSTGALSSCLQGSTWLFARGLCLCVFQQQQQQHNDNDSNIDSSSSNDKASNNHSSIPGFAKHNT